MISEIDLIYFNELSQTLHLTRAAERLGVTQPTLSHSLARIEKTLKTRLFIRTKKGMLLTASGKKLQQQALGLIESWQKLERSIHDEEIHPKGEIRIGCHPSVAQYTLPFVIPQMMKDHPELQFSLQHGLSRHMVDDVLAHKIDVALAINPVRHPDLILRELLQDEVTFWKASHVVNPSVLILDPDLIQSQKLMQKMKKQQWPYQRTIHSSQLDVIKSLVLSGAGCGVLPSRVFTVAERKKVEKVRPTAVYTDTLYLVYRPEFRQISRGKIFIETILKQLSGGLRSDAL